MLKLKTNARLVTEFIEIFAAHRARINAMTDAEYREWKVARAKRIQDARDDADERAWEAGQRAYNEGDWLGERTQPRQ